MKKVYIYMKERKIKKIMSHRKKYSFNLNPDPIVLIQ